LIKKYKIKVVNDRELEVTISKKESISELIKDLDKNNIKISNFRNKRGRLEKLIIKLMK